MLQMDSFANRGTNVDDCVVNIDDPIANSDDQNKAERRRDRCEYK